MCPPTTGSTRKLLPSFEEGEVFGWRLRHWDPAALELRRVRRGAARIPLRGNPGKVSIRIHLIFFKKIPKLRDPMLYPSSTDCVVEHSDNISDST
ncbi:hypothetical protein NDU88_008350 [Pleurodeles waltl]|uniref:Uncharacterized protein n=1 Tax=Pleurodeles waltl TaxID=8319 RepID=A0AAV7RVJ0_PLEWA|nr:hypothetical protein NDU88_008350 [Pleurodeles waltl]